MKRQKCLWVSLESGGWALAGTSLRPLPPSELSRPLPSFPSLLPLFPESQPSVPRNYSGIRTEVLGTP
jgi:hypothetical protein